MPYVRRMASQRTPLYHYRVKDKIVGPICLTDLHALLVSKKILPDTIATDQPLDKLITMANDLNRGKYVCKYTAYENDGENVFQFGVEFIASTTAQVNYMMGHVLRLLPSEVNSVIDSL